MTRVAEGAGRQPESAGQVGGAAVPRGRVKTSQFTAAVGHINHAHPAFVTGHRPLWLQWALWESVQLLKKMSRSNKVAKGASDHDDQWPVASVQPRASNEVVVQVLVFAFLVLTLPAVLLATEILFYFGTIYIDTKLLGKFWIFSSNFLSYFH